MEDLENRRKRALWRASHRGTKELDLLIGSYAEVHVPQMSEARLAAFEAFLASQEPQLQAALLAPEETPVDVTMTSEAAGFVEEIRSFHGFKS